MVAVQAIRMEIPANHKYQCTRHDIGIALNTLDQMVCWNLLLVMPVQSAPIDTTLPLAIARALSFQNVTFPQVTSYSGLDLVTSMPLGGPPSPSLPSHYYAIIN